MTDIDPLVIKIQEAKVDAQKRGFWPTFRALDAAEKAVGAELVASVHRTYDYTGRPVGVTTNCEYCLSVACDKASRWSTVVCELRLIEIVLFEVPVGR